MNTNSEEIRITGDYTQARKLVLKSIITRGTRTIKRTEGGTLTMVLRTLCLYQKKFGRKIYISVVYTVDI